jgi:hypothetical protein
MANKTWYLYEDPELRIVHSDKSCPDARIPAKYNYLKAIDLKTEDDAESLDSRARACERCVKREKSKAMRFRGYKPPPGFR